MHVLLSLHKIYYLVLSFAKMNILLTDTVFAVIQAPPQVPNLRFKALFLDYFWMGLDRLHMAGVRSKTTYSR